MQPAIRALARELLARGLRVTSIVRPGSLSHSRGIALDVTTLDYRVGEYGPNAALEILQIATQVDPSVGWVVASEKDHVHAEVVPPERGLWYGTKDDLVLQLTNANDNRTITRRRNDMNYSRRQDWEAGALPVGSADSIIRATESGALLNEGGDLMSEGGDVGSQAGTTAIAVTVPTSGVIPAGGRSGTTMSSYDSLAAKRAQTISQLGGMQLTQVKALRDLTGPADTFFIFAKNARMDSSTLGPEAKLRSSEARSCAMLITSSTPLAPRVIPVPVVGADFVFDAPDPVFQPNVDFNYVGIILEIGTTIFDADPGRSFSIAVNLLGGPAFLNQLYTFRRLGTGQQMEITMLLGAMIAGVPQFAPQQLRVGAVPVPQFRYTISGLNVANYFVNARYLVRAEQRIEEFLRLIG